MMKENVVLSIKNVNNVLINELIDYFQDECTNGYELMNELINLWFKNK